MVFKPNVAHCMFQFYVYIDEMFLRLEWQNRLLPNPIFLNTATLVTRKYEGRD